MQFTCLCTKSDAIFTKPNKYFECPICGTTHHTYRNRGIWAEEAKRLKESPYASEIVMMDIKETLKE